MTAAATIALIRAGRVKASSITQGELIELVEAAEQVEAYRQQRDEAILANPAPLPCTASPRGYCDRGAERKCAPGSCAHREVKGGEANDVTDAVANLLPSNRRAADKVVSRDLAERAEAVRHARSVVAATADLPEGKDAHVNLATLRHLVAAAGAK